MPCLYRSDYGPIDPSFEPFAGGGRLMKGFEAHVYALAQAQNPGQLEAMKRALERGQPIQWCDQGYGWTYAPGTSDFFYVILLVLILPWLVLRVLPRLARRLPARRTPAAPARPEGLP